MDRMMSFDIKQAIVDSTVDVFDMMLSLPVVYSAEERRSAKSEGNLFLGSIDFMGEVNGIVNIQVSERFAKKMAASMMDIAPEEVEGTEDIQDVLGEVCNMVSGSLKSGLCDAGMICELSTPALIKGKDYNHEARNMARYEFFNFLCEEDLITVDVGIKAANDDVGEDATPAEKLDDQTASIFSYDMENSVSNSVSEVFDMMFSMDVNPFVSTNGTGVGNNRIVGSIGFSGKVLGRLNLHIPLFLSKQMAGNLMGVAPEDVDDLGEVKDVVGEICNMVSGALKSDLCDNGLKCNVSPPSFTTGTDFELECLSLTRHEKFLFNYKDEVFMVEVGLKPSDA